MDRLKQAREDRGLSQAELARRIGITQRAVSGYESGERRPTGDILVRLARALGVSSAYLMGMTDSPTREERLPPDWEKAFNEALYMGYSAGEVLRVLRLARLVARPEEAERPDPQR